MESARELLKVVTPTRKPSLRCQAAGVPGAELAILDRASHVPVPREPAWEGLYTPLEGCAAG